MLNRDDLLELTRRMTVKRANISRIAGCYFDEEGYDEGLRYMEIASLMSRSAAFSILPLGKGVPTGIISQYTKRFLE